MKQKSFDAMLLGVGAVAKVEIEKALAPLRAKVATLEAENMALKHAVKELREKQAEADITPESLKARYASIQ
jgi:cell division protein FtsB